MLSVVMLMSCEEEADLSRAFVVKEGDHYATPRLTQSLQSNTLSFTATFDESAIYHFEEANIMHLGDLLFNKRHPFVDRGAGANMRNWIAVLDKVQKTAGKDTLFIFGHSLNAGEETGTAENLKKFQDYLDKVLKFAEAEIKRGVSKEEFVKNTAVPGVTEWSGQGIERPLTAAYEELTAA